MLVNRSPCYSWSRRPCLPLIEWKPRWISYGTNGQSEKHRRVSWTQCTSFPWRRRLSVTVESAVSVPVTIPWSRISLMYRKHCYNKESDIQQWECVTFPRCSICFLTSVSTGVDADNKQAYAVTSEMLRNICENKVVRSFTEAERFQGNWTGSESLLERFRGVSHNKYVCHVCNSVGHDVSMSCAAM